MVLKELSTSELNDVYTQLYALCYEGTPLSTYLESTDTLANVIVELDRRGVESEERLRKICAGKDDDTLRRCYARLCGPEYNNDVTTLRYQYRLACAREIARRAAQSNEAF